MKIIPGSLQKSLITAAALLGVVASLPAAGSDAVSDGVVESARRVTVSADRLVSDRAARTATFSGRVKVIRGSSTVNADRLTVVYGKNSAGDRVKPPGRSAIERIIAEGNVRIRSEGLTARTPKAVYSRPAQTVELIGAGTRVTSGSNSITGMQIVLHMEGERLTVTSSGDNRVKAVIEPDAKK